MRSLPAGETVLDQAGAAGQAAKVSVDVVLAELKRLRAQACVVLNAAKP